MPLDPVKPMYVRPRPPRRRRGRLGAVVGFAVMIVLVGGVLGSAAVLTNAMGVGERFDSLKDRVALAFNPPPDRVIPDEPVVTPEPDATDEGDELIDPEATPEPTPAVSL